MRVEGLWMGGFGRYSGVVVLGCALVEDKSYSSYMTNVAGICWRLNEAVQRDRTG